MRKVEKGFPLFSNKDKSSAIAECTGAEICISDNGKGIPDDIKEKLFDPFFSTKEASKGSGFGLYNSKAFIEDHNGRIGFISEEGKGSSFFLFIPLFINEVSKKKNLQKARRATREFVKPENRDIPILKLLNQISSRRNKTSVFIIHHRTNVADFIIESHFTVEFTCFVICLYP